MSPRCLNDFYTQCKKKRKLQDNQILRKGENHEIRPDVLVIRVVRKQTSVADSKNEAQLAFLRLHLNQRKRSGKFTA